MNKEEGIQKAGKAKTIALIVVSVLAVIAIIAAGYFYMQFNKQTADKNKPTDMKNKVARLMNVPDETPTLATVTDKTKLKDQPFFKDAQNNDQILIFPGAKKAVIYRESTNRIINAGPIAITSDAKPAATPAPAENKDTKK